MNKVKIQFSCGDSAFPEYFLRTCDPEFSAVEDTEAPEISLSVDANEDFLEITSANATSQPVTRLSLPCDFRKLALRIKKIRYDAQNSPEHSAPVPGGVFSFAEQMIFFDDERRSPISLTESEADVLRQIIKNPRELSAGAGVRDDKSFQSALYRLRKKLENADLAVICERDHYRLQTK